jgi:DNA polymerase III subunit epsilon
VVPFVDLVHLLFSARAGGAQRRLCIAFVNVDLTRVAIVPERVVRASTPATITRSTTCAGPYDIDRSHRSKHGALFGAELLAAVYVELTCARQSALHLQLLALATSNIQNAAPPIAAAGDR